MVLDISSFFTFRYTKQPLQTSRLLSVDSNPSRPSLVLCSFVKWKRSWLLVCNDTIYINFLVNVILKHNECTIQSIHSVFLVTCNNSWKFVRSCVVCDLWECVSVRLRLCASRTVWIMFSWIQCILSIFVYMFNCLIKCSYVHCSLL